MAERMKKSLVHPYQGSGGPEKSLIEGKDSLNLAWLIRLRWWAVIGQALVVLSASAFLSLKLPFAILFSLISFTACTNLFAHFHLRRSQEKKKHRLLLRLLMILDVMNLTALLYFSGGAENPFSVLYLVNIALGVIILGPFWTSILAVLSFLGFGLLFVNPFPLHFHSQMGHQSGHHFHLHLYGMWIAYGIASFLMVYFLYRLTRSLRKREQDLAKIRDRETQQEKIATLATLSAGAAHELSTPLATIAVVAKELSQKLKGIDAGVDVVDDAILIRDQVRRCREILDRMSGFAGEAQGEKFVVREVPEFFREVLNKYASQKRIRLEFDSDTERTKARLPVEALSMVLQALVKNALQATDGEVRVKVGKNEDSIHVSVEDEGEGIEESILARIGEPFFTTKPPGEGQGLGLFLSRNVIEHLDGDLDVSSAPGRGTHVRFRIPYSSFGAGGGMDAQA